MKTWFLFIVSMPWIISGASAEDAPGTLPVAMPYTVFIGMETDASSALFRIEKLRKMGYAAYIGYDRFSRPPENEYTIHVGSWRSPSAARTAAKRYHEKGCFVFLVSSATDDSGLWHRVFTGRFDTREKALERAVLMKKEGASYAAPRRMTQNVFPVCMGWYSNREAASEEIEKLSGDVFFLAQIRKKPYALQVGVSDVENELLELEKRLRERGFYGYRIPDRRDGRIRVLVGAFAAETDMKWLEKNLVSAGFRPKTVLR